MTPESIAAMRRIAAHFDIDDPSRKPVGRGKANVTVSPYRCDFEEDTEAMIDDVRLVLSELRLIESEVAG